MRVELERSIAAIDATTWDRLEGGRSLYLSHRWLTWAEQDADFSPAYAVVRDADDRIVGALPTYLWHGDGGSLNAWYDPWKVFVARRVPVSVSRDDWLPVLLLGSRCGYHGDILVDGGLDALQQRSVIRLLMGAAERIAVGAGARSVALMYLPQDSAERVGELDRHGGLCVATSAGAVIGTEGGNFDDYLSQFTRRRRSTLKWEIKTFEAAGVDVREDRLGASCAQIGPLLARLRRKHGADDTDQDAIRYLQEQADVLDGISRVFLETRAGRVVGFSLCYEWAGALYVRASGFDVGGGSARFAYFNLAVYWPVRYAIEHGLREVNLGASSYQAKVSRGAVLIPLWSVVWPPLGADAAALAALRYPAAEAAEAHAVVAGASATNA